MRHATLCILMAAACWAQRQPGTPAPKAQWDPARLKALQQIMPLTTAVREDDHPAMASARRPRLGGLGLVSPRPKERASCMRARSRTASGPRLCRSPRRRAIITSPRSRSPTMARCGSPGPRRCASTGTSTAACSRGHMGKDRTLDDACRDRIWRRNWPPLEGRVLLVWQSLRKDNLDILYRVHQGSAWGEEGFVTENPANDWEPVVAAYRDGSFHVAWDSYRGDYDVMYRSFGTSGWGSEMAVAASARLENHATLAVDERDRVWVAFEIGPEKWAADSANGGLRPRRDIGLACVMNGRLLRATAAEAALGQDRGRGRHAGAGALV